MGTPSPSLLYLPEGSAGANAFRDWLRAEDPGLLYSYTDPVPELEAAAYSPSFRLLKTPLRTVSGEAAAPVPSIPALIPSAVSGPTWQPREPTPIPAGAGQQARTKVVLEGDLASRSEAGSLELDILADAPLRNPSFLIGVGPGGEILHLFAESGSGDSAFDARVVNALKQLKLPRGEKLDFGMARIQVAYSAAGAGVRNDRNR